MKKTVYELLVIQDYKFSEPAYIRLDIDDDQH